MSDINKRINEIKLESSELKMGVNSSVKKVIIRKENFDFLIENIEKLAFDRKRLEKELETSEYLRLETIKENHRLNEVVDSLQYVQYFLGKRR